MKFVGHHVDNKLYFWNKSQINLELSQTEARKLNQRLFLDLEFIVVAIGVSRSPKFVKQLE